MLYELFSTFTEVDNLFRLYAISFDDKSFKDYQNKLDTLNKIIHTLDSIPTNNTPNSAKKEIEVLDQSLSMQFLALKRQIDNLIIFAGENFTNNNIGLRSQQRGRLTNSDSVINRILNDTLARVEVDADTIVKKKQSLFKRIFNAKNDTVLNTSSSAVLNVNQIDIVQKNIENLIRTNEESYSKNFSNLRSIYLRSKEKERKLITSNYQLINDLKKSI